MRYFVLDTNFLLLYLRNTSTALNDLIANHRLEENDAVQIISVVTIGEIQVLAKRNNWGNSRLEALDRLLKRLMVIDISAEDQHLMDAYVDFDVFSNSIGRTMGKNDLWIAATAFVTNATLVTSDGDFDHLENRIQFLKIPVR